MMEISRQPLPGASILAQISDPIIAVDFLGQVLFWNRGAERLYGLTSDEVLGKATSAAYRVEWPHDADENAMQEEVRHTGEAAGEALHILHDGRKVSVQFQAYLYRDEKGRAVGFIQTIREVKTSYQQNRSIGTASTRDQEELQKRAALLDGANDAIFVTALDGSITYWNKGAERLYGWSIPEVMGKDERELLSAEYPVPYTELVSLLLREGHWEGVVTRHRKGGEPLTVCSRWSLLRDAHGNPLSRMVINTDLTETKIAFEEMRRAEAEARARASELEAILDAIPGATFIAHDPRCHTMTSSRAAYELLRILPGSNSSKSAPAGEGPTTFTVMKDGREVSPEDLPIQQAAATGLPVTNAEVTLVFDDGTSRDILGNAVPLLNDEGAVRGAVGCFIDVTERNAAIRTARRQESILRAVIDNSSDFIFLKDPEGRYLVANPAAASAAGRVPEDFLGKTDFEVFPADTAERHMNRDRQVMATRTPATFEDQLRLKGESRHIQTLKNVCLDAEGQIIGVVGITRDITENKLNEMRLAASESRYRSLTLATANIVWTTDPQGRPLDDLASWRAFTGQTLAEVAGTGTADAIHPDDRERTMRAMQEAIAGGTKYEIKHRIRRHDGVHRTMLARAVPVCDASGTIVEWVGIHTDITEQRQAENSLRQSDSRFRRLFESDLMGIGIPDRFGAFVEANDELLRITGYTREDLEAGLVRWDRMTPSEYRELDTAHIAEAAQRGTCTPYEKEYIRKDGIRVAILCGYALLEGSKDEYIGFVHDLTQRKLAEAALREREQRFRVLADSLPQLVWIANAEGENVFCNRKLTEFHGFDPERAPGLFWRGRVHPDDLASVEERWDRCMRSNEPFVGETWLRRFDGQYRLFSSRAVPILDESGNVDQWVGVSTDIHEQKAVEKALRQTEKLAAAGRLAASIAHEINNPLESVVNSLYLALMDTTLSRTTRSYLQIADKELTRLAHVTQQTLRFHKQSTAPSNASLAKIMDSALSSFAQRLGSSNVEVAREYRTGQTLYCYADEIRQAFAHVLSNSIDATQRGGRIRIRIREARAWDSTETRGIKVIVADTGIGIPAGLINRLFEPFVTSKDPTGAGLGLWVTEGIIKKQNGRIAIRSRTDSRHHGTVVSMFLPFVGTSD